MTADTRPSVRADCETEPMGTLVCLHAHPDDEAISTGGTMARASAEGHRVVLIVATDGAVGETPDDLGDQNLVDRRRAETMASAAALGIHRVAWLGYADSGMTGWEQNDDPDSFHQAPVEEAAEKVADILREEDADVFTIYDWHGTYGHPDHVKVHTVGRRAGELVDSVRVLQATANRDAMKQMIDAARESGVDVGPTDGDDEFDPTGPADDGNPFGEPESDITLCVDIGDFVTAKKEALRAHSSQVDESSFFMQMPDEVFRQAFGREWYIEDDATPPYRTGWIFDPVPSS